MAIRAPGGDDSRRAPQGRIDEAAAYLRHARELGSSSAASFKDVGEALARLGRYEAATEHFRQAMHIDPHDDVALDHLAFNHFRGKRYAQALALCEEPRDAAGTPQGLTLNQVTERSLTHSTLICSAMMSMTSLDFGAFMIQVTARLPDSMVEMLDSAASQMHCNRAEVIRHAIDRYLEDFGDLSIAIGRLRDPTDHVLDWSQVRRELLESD